MSEPQLISVSEAAEKLGISRWRINQLINEKRLPAKKIGRAYVIKESDLALVKDRKPGRPSKSQSKN